MKNSLLLLLVTACMACAESHWPEPPQKGKPLPAPSIHVDSMTLAELFEEAQQYAMTPETRANKIAAKKKFFSFETEALSFLMSRMDIENLWLRVYAYELARAMPAEKAVPTLLSHLNIEEINPTRYALHILGFFDAPESVPDLSEYFSHEKTEGAAIRLAGKWKQAENLDLIIPYLSHQKERLRIMAVNALRDVGLEETRPYLEEALNDEFFTVRKCAERALNTLDSNREM